MKSLNSQVTTALAGNSIQDTTKATPDFDDDDDYDEDDEDQALSVDDAALIWLSNGMDEDYTFGYSEDELRDALD